MMVFQICLFQNNQQNIRNNIQATDFMIILYF